MIDIKHIESKGGDQESLRKKFERPYKDGSKIKELTELHSARMQEAVDRNLREARIWSAIDSAYDASRDQITYTLVKDLLERNPKSDEMLDAAKNWGLQNMLAPMWNPDGTACCAPGTTTQLKRLELPTFFNVKIPAVMAYTKTRWAKIFNDRDLYPLYKYQPIRYTTLDRIRCEIITNRVQRMSQEMGYRDDERQNAFQTLLYGQCLNFPMEHWHSEKQYFDGEMRTERSGVRFAIPHPSRTFVDGAHRITTVNSDTGCEYYGYWDMMRYGQIRNSEAFWNRDKITFGIGNWPPWNLWHIYSTLYPCRCELPNPCGAGGNNDRTGQTFEYAQTDNDKGVLVTVMFHKLVPKDWDLFDYDQPIWMRFVYGGDDTVLQARPLGFRPGTAYLYDYDCNRNRNTSLALEILPWQDLLGNYLSQYLLSVKNNLTNVVFWNADLLEEKDVTLIRNLGEQRFRDIPMIPFSKEEWKWQNSGPQDAFYPLKLANLNVQEIANCIVVMLNLMERMLGFTAQELGAAAAHEQSAREISLVTLNRETRLQFTGGFFDSGMHAKKRLLYDAMMTYDDDEIFAEVAALSDQDKKALEKLGFTVEIEADSPAAKAGVVGKKSKLVVEGFTAEREGANRVTEEKIAVAMLQAFQTVFTNPLVVQSVGVEQIVDKFNDILSYAGLPADWRLRVKPGMDNPQQQAEDLGGQMQKIAESVVGKAMGDLGTTMRDKVIGPISDGQKQLQDAVMLLAQKQQEGEQRDAVQQEALAKIAQVMEAAAATAMQPAAPAPLIEAPLAAPAII